MIIVSICTYFCRSDKECTEKKKKEYDVTFLSCYLSPWPVLDQTVAKQRQNGGGG